LFINRLEITRLEKIKHQHLNQSAVVGLILTWTSIKLSRYSVFWMSSEIPGASDLVSFTLYVWPCISAIPCCQNKAEEKNDQSGRALFRRHTCLDSAGKLWGLLPLLCSVLLSRSRGRKSYFRRSQVLMSAK